MQRSRKDYALAFFWYKQAAALQGHSDAQKQSG